MTKKQPITVAESITDKSYRTVETLGHMFKLNIDKHIQKNVCYICICMHIYSYKKKLIWKLEHDKTFLALTFLKRETQLSAVGLKHAVYHLHGLNLLYNGIPSTYLVKCVAFVIETWSQTGIDLKGIIICCQLER